MMLGGIGELATHQAHDLEGKQQILYRVIRLLDGFAQL